MAGDHVFMDTAALLALASKRDSFHTRAVKVRDRITRVFGGLHLNDNL
jgi:predicted nucleic acid-binding protein